MEPTEPKNSNLENNLHENVSEKDPYSGIFFELEPVFEKAKAGCVQRLQPLVGREPKKDELFACIEVFNYQDFGLNYNTFSKDLEPNFEQLGDESAIPGLQESIESYLQGKSTSQEQNQAFDEKLRKKLFDFFSDCWKQAGGASAKMPTYFCFEEEEYELMDFQTGKTYSDEEIAAKLN